MGHVAAAAADIDWLKATAAAEQFTAMGPAVESSEISRNGRPGGAFSLLFAGPKGAWLPQAIYPVRHPALGVIDIFLVPIVPLEDGNGYQAVFTSPPGASGARQRIRS